MLLVFTIDDNCCSFTQKKEHFFHLVKILSYYTNHIHLQRQPLQLQSSSRVSLRQKYSVSLSLHTNKQCNCLFFFFPNIFSSGGLWVVVSSSMYRKKKKKNGNSTMAPSVSLQVLGVYSFSSSVNTRGQYFIWIKFVANGLRTCHRLCNSKQTGDFGDDKSARRRRVSRSFFFPRHCEVCQPAAGSSEPLNDRVWSRFLFFFFLGCRLA